ncbi:MAG: hypothetical protein V4674_01780 [Patescibacteria group bacterium]
MAKASKAAQEFLPIDEIHDGVVVLKDGTLAMALICSSLNFALKSADEQTAIISQYQNFLNSLDFSVQIYIQSRRLDIRPYISLLEERMKVQVNDLIKIQTREYVQFIKSFTDSVSIMTKTFFVIIPYTPPFAVGQGKAVGFLGTLFGSKQNSAETGAKREAFEENRAQLEQRASVVAQGLVRAGVRALPLGTEELVELFYKIFNPGDLERPVVEGMTSVTAQAK